jgi:hypothetical protein
MNMYHVAWYFKNKVMSASAITPGSFQKDALSGKIYQKESVRPKLADLSLNLARLEHTYHGIT